MPSNKQHKPDYSKAPIESQRRMGRYIPSQQEPNPSQKEPKHHPTIKSFVWMEKRVWEPLLAWGENQALISLLGLLGNVGIIVAALTYVGLEEQRRESQVYLAWQTITNAQGQPGNGGRILALEFLNASPGANWRLRFPWICVSEEWFCSKWEGESLGGVDVSRAYLANIQLPGARLSEANLQGANLEEANLKKANLSNINLQNAVLVGANLQEANLTSAKLQGALYTDELTSELRCAEFVSNISCPTLFPDNFDPQAAGMKLIR